MNMELLQEGVVGLLRALERYTTAWRRPSRLSSFSRGSRTVSAQSCACAIASNHGEEQSLRTIAARLAASAERVR